MAFEFFKKKSNNNEEENSNKLPDKRRSEMISSVLDESVPSASIDIIRSNTNFEIGADNEGNSRYLVITFDTNTIGGLNKQVARGNNDKGQLIECINSGNIEAHITSESDYTDKFVIIPTEKTIQSLSEFNFLANKDIFCSFIPTECIINQNGQMEFKEYEAAVAFEWFNDISKGHVELSRAISDISSVSNSLNSFNTSVNTVSEQTFIPNSEQSFVMKTEDNNNVQQETFQNFVEKEEPGVFEQAEIKANEYEDELPFKIDDDKLQTESENNSEIQTDFFKPENLEEFDYENNIKEYDEADMEMCPSCYNYIDINEEECPFCGEILVASVEEEEIVQDEQTVYKKADDVVRVQAEYITDDDVQNAVERLFYSDEIELEISAHPFDVRIGGANKYVDMIEDRSDSWLDSYASQMIKSANEELCAMHQDNLLKSRQRYLALMNENAENIANDVDYRNESSHFHEMYKFLLKEKEKAINSLDDIVAQKRAEKEAEWELEVEQARISAAAKAEQNYYDSNRRNHEQILRDIEIDAKDEADKAHAQNMQNLNESRKTEAKKRFDIAITETLKVIEESYNTMLKQEDARRNELLADIQNYIDSHLKDEVARNAVLAESQRQKEEADKVVLEFNRKIDAMVNDHKIACEKLNTELNNAHVHENNVIREYDTKLLHESDRYKELENKYNDLMNRYVNVELEKAKEYESRINTLENDKKAVEEHLAHVDIVHNKFNKVSVTVWISIAVAMFAVGALVGNALSAGQKTGGKYSISLTSPSNEEEINTTDTEK